jgi:iron complex outermembrane receptor protein
MGMLKPHVVMALGVGLAGIPVSGAMAQSPPAQADAQRSDPQPRTDVIDQAFGEVVITATKKVDPENVQKVPAAITAFNQATLDALNVRDLQGLTTSVPNVSLDQVGTQKGTANFSIRGLGVNSSIPSIDPTVGVFIDGVYLGISNGVVLDLFDLDSVEILRGPQGILFGRNTTGGAVLINTGNPTRDFRFKFRGSVDGPVDPGRGAAAFTVNAVASGPLVEDILLFKIGAYHNSDGGYYKNQVDGRDVGKAETTIVRGGLQWNAGDRVTLLGKIDYLKTSGDGAVGKNMGFTERDSFVINEDMTGYSRSETLLATLRADIDLGPGVVTNIFGYREYNVDSSLDGDATPSNLFNIFLGIRQHQYSNELRYAVDLDRVNFTVGSFYFKQRFAYDEARTVLATNRFFGGGVQDHEVLGLFGQGQFKLTDALSVIGGIRWSKETKDVGVTYIRPRTPCSILAGTCPFTGQNSLIPTEGNGFIDKHDWSSWAPKLQVQYERDNTLAYASWSRGYRSGGYNFRISSATAFEQVANAVGYAYFDQEKVDTYEVGVKFQTADRGMTLNLAAYRTDVNNMQREVNAPSASAGLAQSIYNTANARIWGAEAEGRLRLSRHFALTGNVGYIDAEYRDIFFDISGNGSVGPEDYMLALPRVPKWTWGVGFLHELTLSKGSIVTRANFQHRDRFAYTDSNLGWIRAFDNLDFNIAWNTPLGPLTLSIYGKNMLDHLQIGSDSQTPFGGPLSAGTAVPFGAPAAGSFSPVAGRGRVIGMEIAIDF